MESGVIPIGGSAGNGVNSSVGVVVGGTGVTAGAQAANTTAKKQ